MKRSEEPEISLAAPIRHPRSIGVEPVVTVLVLEAVGGALNQIWHWPWWIGAQAPVVYLLMRWSEERRFAHRLSRAWNTQRDAQAELSRQVRETRRGDGVN